MRREVTGRAGPPPSWSCSQALSPVVTEAAPASRPAAGASLLLRGVWPAWQVAVGPGPALGAGAESRGAGRQGGLCAGRDWGRRAWEGGAGLGARQTDGTRPSDGHWAPSPRLGVRPQVWGTSSVRPPSLPTPAANRGPPGTHTSDCPPSSALPLPVSPKVGLPCSRGARVRHARHWPSGPGSRGFTLGPRSPAGRRSGSRHRPAGSGGVAASGTETWLHVARDVAPGAFSREGGAGTPSAVRSLRARSEVALGAHPSPSRPARGVAARCRAGPGGARHPPVLWAPGCRVRGPAATFSPAHPVCLPDPGFPPALPGCRDSESCQFVTKISVSVMELGKPIRACPPGKVGSDAP